MCILLQRLTEHVTDWQSLKDVASADISEVPKLETFKWKSFSFAVIDERLCFRYLAFILFGTEGDYY